MIETKTLSVEAFEIAASTGLDPIRVILHDLGPYQGRIIVECYGRAWSAYWAATGEDRVAQFVLRVDYDYLARALTAGGKRTSKQEDAYMLRLAKAVQAGLRHWLQPEVVAT